MNVGKDEPEFIRVGGTILGKSENAIHYQIGAKDIWFPIKSCRICRTLEGDRYLEVNEELYRLKVLVEISPVWNAEDGRRERIRIAHENAIADGYTYTWRQAETDPTCGMPGRMRDEAEGSRT